MPEDTPNPVDRELLVRAELALTQLNNAHGLDPDQSATLAAIRLRLEGKQRASLDDLLTAGRDLRGKDPLARPGGLPGGPRRAAAARQRPARMAATSATTASHSSSPVYRCGPKRR